MRAGALRERMSLFSRVTSRDGHGQLNVTSWSLLAEVWAQRLITTGREAVADHAGIVPGDITTFRIRRRSDVTTLMRAEVGASAYDIISVKLTGRRLDALELECRLGVKDGA